MAITQRIDKVLVEINSINNWDEPYFDWRKAYVAAVFAKVAYLHVPQFELKNVNRANIIPCVEYREILNGAESPGVRNVLRNSEFGNFFIVEKPYVVAVVVKVKNVLFISLRGTQYLYDWLVNFNIFKTRLYSHSPKRLYFHSGFNRAISSCMCELHMEILRRYGYDNTIYVTGHSLGGALAAILHSRWHNGYEGALAHFNYHPNVHDYKYQLSTHSCYTFGMPRYANSLAIEKYPCPFHVYNRDDIVPLVPPRFMGYGDVPIEYCLTSEGEVDYANNKGSSFLGFIFKLVTWKGIQEHEIELYMDRTKYVCEQLTNRSEKL